MIILFTNTENLRCRDLLICRSEDHYVVATIVPREPQIPIKIWNIDKEKDMVVWYFLKGMIYASHTCKVYHQGDATRIDRMGAIKVVGYIIRLLHKLPILPKTITESQTLKVDSHTDLNKVANYLAGE